MTAPRTLYDKLWQSHVVHDFGDGSALLYIDRHLIHEVTSPQAFAGLRAAGRRVRRPDATVAVVDHIVSTTSRDPGLLDTGSRRLVDTLERNVADFAIPYIPLAAAAQGIVHVVGPEQGLSLPGMTIVCGDSHSSTHGALGALAFGIGTSEVEHVLATQTLRQTRSRTMRVTVDGRLAPGVSAKDLVLAIIGRIGTAGGTGHVIEFAGSTIRALSIAGRMTICNMAIEAGARSGLVAPDAATFAYLRGRPFAPAGDALERAIDGWRGLASDPGAKYDAEVAVDAATIAPMVTWGTSPEDVVAISGGVPLPDDVHTADARAHAARARAYMGLRGGEPMIGIAIDRVFVGSCTNGRIEDLRSAAAILDGRRIAAGVRAIAVPGSGLVKAQAEREGLDRIFRAAGFEWREPGCSLCVAINGDRLEPGERCASTSNRNFEGRQGAGGRTHLMSPAMAVAAAITGQLTDVRGLL